MKPMALALFIAAISSVLVGCGRDHHKQDGVYEIDYILLSPDSYGLSRRLFKNRIGVCINGADTEERRSFVDLAFSAWAKPLRDLNPNIVINHDYNCSDYALKINWSNSDGRAFTNIDYDSVSMHLYANSFFETVQHEFGHAFGLADTYNTNDQPDSAMRLGRYGEPVLYPNDIDGVQKVFTNIQKDGNPQEIYSNEESCMTPDGQEGSWRKVKSEGHERQTKCVSKRNNAKFSFELKTTDCEDSHKFYGLFSTTLDQWLENVGVTYSCELN